MSLKYVPIPVALLAIGKPLPVDVWSASGQLLLRKGQPVVSEEHRAKLHAHSASSTAADAHAWQRAYERMVHTLLSEGVDVQDISRASMPSEIRESDYIVGQQLQGGWLDLQEVLRGILYQGGLAINPLERLFGIEKVAQQLLQADTDDSLFSLFQTLADTAQGYCATHALLCAVVCELTGQKLALPVPQRGTLFRAALVMNIGMARDQDSLARQHAAPTPWQRTLIQEHPQRSADILSGIGLSDPELLDVVRWHHEPDSPQALPPLAMVRRILATADSFVAKMASRRTRASLSPVRAVKSMVMGAQGVGLGVGSAMAQAAGFYPPGTYVLLANGETAVTVQRGERANTPWVIPILDKDGIALGKWACKETTTPASTIATAVPAEKIKVTLGIERVRKAREKIRHL
jgi:HD-GYP domain-containing protein (c-di-GMP phosphodiesterase class II)